MELKRDVDFNKATFSSSVLLLNPDANTYSSNLCLNDFHACSLSPVSISLLGVAIDSACAIVLKMK